MNFIDKNNKILKNINNNLEYKKNYLKNNFNSKFSINKRIDKSNKRSATCNSYFKRMEYFCDKIFNDEISEKVGCYKNLVYFYKNSNYFIIHYNMIKKIVLKNKKKKKFLFEHKNENEALKKDAENYQNIIKEEYMKIKKYNQKFYEKIGNTGEINKGERINKEKSFLKIKKIGYKMNLYETLAIFLENIIKKYFFLKENKVRKYYLILFNKKRNEENANLKTHKCNKINFIKKYSQILPYIFTYSPKISHIQRKNEFFSDKKYIKKNALFLKRLNFKLRKIFYTLNIHKFMKISIKRRHSKIKDRKKKFEVNNLLKKKVKYFIYDPYNINYQNILYKIKKIKGIPLSNFKLLKFHLFKLKRKIQNIENLKQYSSKLKCKKFKKCIIINNMEFIISYILIAKLNKKDIFLMKKKHDYFFFIIIMKNKKLADDVINIQKKYNSITLKKIQKCENDFKSIKHAIKSKNILKNENFNKEIQNINKEVIKEKLYIKKCKFFFYNFFITEIILSNETNNCRCVNKKILHETYFLIYKKKMNKIIIIINKNITNYIKKRYKYLYNLKKTRNFIIKQFIVKLCSKNELFYYIIKHVKGSRRKLHILKSLIHTKIKESYEFYNIKNIILKYLDPFKGNNHTYNKIKINNTGRPLELDEKKMMTNNNKEGITDYLMKNNDNHLFKKWINNKNISLKPSIPIENTENRYNNRKRNFSTFYLNVLNKCSNNKYNELIYVKNKYNKINFFKRNVCYRDMPENLGHCESNNNNNSNMEYYLYNVKKKVMMNSSDKICRKLIIEEVIDKEDKKKKEILLINLISKEKSGAKKVLKKDFKRKCNFIRKCKIKISNKINNDNYKDNTKEYLNMNKNNLIKDVNSENNHNSYFNILNDKNNSCSISLCNSIIYNKGYSDNTTNNSIQVYFNNFDSHKIIDILNNLLLIKKRIMHNENKELRNGINYLSLKRNNKEGVVNSLGFNIVSKCINYRNCLNNRNLKYSVKYILKNKYKKKNNKKVFLNSLRYRTNLNKNKKLLYLNKYNYYKIIEPIIPNKQLKKEDILMDYECTNVDLYKNKNLNEFSNLVNDNKNEIICKYEDARTSTEACNKENEKYKESNFNSTSYFRNSANGKLYFENSSNDDSGFEDNLNRMHYFKNKMQKNYCIFDIFEEKSLETELSIKSISENTNAFIRNGKNNSTAISSEINEENMLNENLMNNRLIDDSSLLYEKESKEMVQKKRKKNRKKKKNLDCVLNEDLPLESIDNILKTNCDINLGDGNNEEEEPIEENIGSDNNMNNPENNVDLEVAVMERHSSILINRGIKTKKCVDYSLYNTYAKSSFLQCAEQADNHFIGNYLDRYNDENFYHLRQKIKLCLSRTFANLKTTSETCVLHFTNLIFDLYISRFNSKEEIIDSIINDIVTEEKQFSDVMVQLLKEFYPKIYNDFIYKEQLKNKYKILYQELKESCDLIYHFIAIICLFISQKYYNYRLISIDLIAKTYCKSHLEGLRKVYSLNNELIKDASPDYYSATQYLDTTFSTHSVNKNFALEVEICILKKLNYDLSIPTAYSLLDSLLKANENINFLKVRNDYNSTEGEILLRIANIDNIFLKYKSSTLSMAIYEILNFNICKDKMQKELFDFTKLNDFDNAEEKSKEIEMNEDLELEKKEKDKNNELKFLKRQVRSLIIAEEEDRFITASKYINEKTKIYKFIKKIIIKLCFLIKKKIPKSYYNCDYNLSEKLNSHIKRFHKSKIVYLNRLKMKLLNKVQKDADNNIKQEEKEKSFHKNSSESIYKVNEEGSSTNTIIDDQKEVKGNNKKHKMEQKEAHKYESEKKMKLLYDTNRKNVLIENAEERRKKLEEIKNDKEKFQLARNKIIEKLNKCIKKLVKLKYEDIPIKYCTSYVLEGDKLKVYIKKYNENKNLNNANEMMERNSYSIAKDASTNYNKQTKSKNNYIIGTRTKSTDEHLVYYYNYVSKLKSKLIKGLKYFLRRIKKIKNREIYVKKISMNFLLKKGRGRKKKREKKMKNVPLYKQLLNEIKIFFLWIYKLTNIEIRPLINFSDLKFMSLIKYYEKNYSKYVLRKLHSMAEDNVELNKVDEKNPQNNKTSSISTIHSVDNGDSNNDNKNKRVQKNLHKKKNNALFKKYIEEVEKTIEGEKIFHPFLKSSEAIKRLRKEENIEEQKENIKNSESDNINDLLLNNEKCENAKNKAIFYEKMKYMKNKGIEIIDEEKKKKESEKNKDDDVLLGKKEHESLEKQKDKFGENTENNHIFSVTNFENLAKINSDWITINDPQVDECAKELMECFLKWKNQNYISKNWTFNEYPNCKEYYFSLVFGDLKSSEALKGIIEMMHMKYNHLLNIYKEINIQNNLLNYE